MKRLGRRLGWTLFGACAAAALAALVDSRGVDDLIARLLLKPGHIIVEQRPDAAYERLVRREPVSRQAGRRRRYRRACGHVSEGGVPGGRRALSATAPLPSGGDKTRRPRTWRRHQR